MTKDVLTLLEKLYYHSLVPDPYIDEKVLQTLSYDEAIKRVKETIPEIKKRTEELKKEVEHFFKTVAPEWDLKGHKPDWWERGKRKES